MTESARPETPYQCPLCGNRFLMSESKPKCAGCSKKGCGLVCCPNCGYSVPEENTRIARGLRGLLNRNA